MTPHALVIDADLLMSLETWIALPMTCKELQYWHDCMHLCGSKSWLETICRQGLLASCSQEAESLPHGAQGKKHLFLGLRQTYVQITASSVQ